jgi:hypothetical protein
MSETLVKMPEKHWKTQCKHMHHPDKTLANICMKHLKTLETYVCNMHVYATSTSTFATSRQNNCNIHLEQMKHLEYTLETDAREQASERLTRRLAVRGASGQRGCKQGWCGRVQGRSNGWTPYKERF